MHEKVTFSALKVTFRIVKVIFSLLQVTFRNVKVTFSAGRVTNTNFSTKNSFPEKRFQKNVSFVSWSLARVYIVLKQENNPLIPLIPHLRVYH